MSTSINLADALIQRALKDVTATLSGTNDDEDESSSHSDTDDAGSVSWQHQQSLATDEAALSSTNISIGAIMGIVSGNIAAAIVTGYIVPSTDALFLVLVGAILTVIVLIALGKLFYWVALAATRGTSQSGALEGPRSERERRREQLSVGVWANVLLLLCQFLMLISAFVALQLLLEMFKLYYQTMPPGMLLQLIAIVWLVLIILFFLVYPGIGLFGHANDVIDSGATKRAAR